MIFENITVLYMDLPQELQLKKKNNTNLPINVIIPKWKERDNKDQSRCFPDGSMVKNLPANVGDTGLIPALRRSHMQCSN